MKIDRRTLLMGSLSLGVSQAVPARADTIQVVDALGRTVVVKHPVERVITTFNYEEFTAVAGVDGWKKVVGMSRTPWEAWRPAIFSKYKAVIPNLGSMPDVGYYDDNTFSVEKVIALKPDVLFMAEFSFNAIGDVRRQIEAAGIPIVVIDYNAQLLDRHLASTRAFGAVMGTPARAEELASLYERKYKDIMARVASARSPKPPRAYVELGQAGPETFGNTYNGTIWGKIFTLMGATNIAEGKIPGPWGPLNAEAVIASNPDAIFITGSSWVNSPRAVKTGYDTSPDATRASLLPYAARAGWANLAAVKSGNFNAIEHGMCRTLFDFVAMEFIGKRLYPDAFRDVEPERSFRDYHAQFLPVAYSGSWMLALQS